MDMDEFLKKAMESELKGGDTDGDEVPHIPDEHLTEAINGMFTLMGSGKLLKLAKAAMAKKDILIKELIEYLGKLDQSDKPSFHTHAAVRIQRVAQQIKVLDAIISASVISIGANEDEMNDTVDKIINVNML